LQETAVWWNIRTKPQKELSERKAIWKIGTKHRKTKRQITVWKTSFDETS
jgi:hypothetical protein